MQKIPSFYIPHQVWSFVKFLISMGTVLMYLLANFNENNLTALKKIKDLKKIFLYYNLNVKNQGDERVLITMDRSEEIIWE